jgi:hypothetical protein
MKAKPLKSTTGTEASKFMLPAEHAANLGYWTVIRRVILFLLAGALLGAGAYLLFLRAQCDLGLTPGGCYPIQVRMLAMVAFMMSLGGYVLLTEFLVPWLGKLRL